MPRPASVTLLALAVLCLSAFNLLGVLGAIQSYTFLSTLPLSVSSAYLVAGRAVWGLTFAALAVGLWRLKAWGRAGMLVAFTLYVAHSWLDRLVFARSDFVRVTMPYALAWDVVSLALVWGILLRRKVRQRFSH
jgi:hypothetical protein